MDAFAFAKIHPKEFHRKFFEQKVRPDGRALLETRQPVIAHSPIPSAAGSAMVKIGNTSVICGIKLEVGRPQTTTPKDGLLVVMVDLSPLCSPNFSIGKASTESVALSEQIFNHIVSTQTFPLDQLCIKEGQSAWTLYADVVCLNYDGNVLDASILAVMAALKGLRLPGTEVDPDDGEVFVNPHAVPTPLVLNRFLLPVTFAALGDFVVADPNNAEEEVVDSRWTIVHDETGQLCGLHKPGGRAVPVSDLKVSLALAKTKAAEMWSALAPTFAS